VSEAGGSADSEAAGLSSFRIVVLASGSGTNLQAIIDKLHRRPLADGSLTEVALVVSDVPGAWALERARAAGIATFLCPADRYRSRAEHDLAMVEAILNADVDLVVLAGYMRLVSPEFVTVFRGRIINLHPALLPAFPGTRSISDAVRYGVKVTGVTVHYVDEGLDTGPIIAQEPVRVEEGDTPETLAARIHAVEHELLPATIRMIAEGRASSPLPGSRVVQVDWNTDEDKSNGIG
jgi:phosphoribosylglycinamide formyltransferase-1